MAGRASARSDGLDVKRTSCRVAATESPGSRIPARRAREQDARMFTTLRSPLARIAIPALLVTGSLGMAHPAAAKDYCVGQISCVAPATSMPSLSAALSAAAAGPDADHIILSGETFTAPSVNGWSYDNSSGPLEISGQGVGQTILTGPAPLNRLMALIGGPGSKIRDLSIQLPQMAQQSTGVQTTADLERVAVGEATPQSQMHTGLSLAGATLSDSSVTLDPSSNTTGVSLVGATMRNSVVSANDAVLSFNGGLIERSWLTGSTSGLVAWAATTGIENSVIRVNGTLGTGIAATRRFGTSPVVNADGLTVVAGLGGAHSAVDAEAANAGNTAEINLK